MRERKLWTEEEDEILKHLRDVEGELKWSTIAKRMEEEYFLSGRSGKQCREREISFLNPRYQNHLDESIKQEEWSELEDKTLIAMHNEVGNRWCIIAHKIPGRYALNFIERSDNCVKNRFYSKMRKSVRKLNRIICEHFRKDFKQIKNPLLYKIIETSEAKFKISSSIDEEVSNYCSGTFRLYVDIKNKLFFLEKFFPELEREEEDKGKSLETIKTLIYDIEDFNRKDKKKVKFKYRKASGWSKEFLHPNMYLPNKSVKSSHSESDSERESSSFMSSSIKDEDEYQIAEMSRSMSKSLENNNDYWELPNNNNKSRVSEETANNTRITRSRSKCSSSFENKSPTPSGELSLSDDASSLFQWKDSKFSMKYCGIEEMSSINEQQNPNHSSYSSNSHDNNKLTESILFENNNIIEEKSSGSNKHSKNSHENSPTSKSFKNMFCKYLFIMVLVEESQFQMRILSPKEIDHEKDDYFYDELFYQPVVVGGSGGQHHQQQHQHQQHNNNNNTSSIRQRASSVPSLNGFLFSNNYNEQQPNNAEEKFHDQCEETIKNEVKDDYESCLYFHPQQQQQHRREELELFIPCRKNSASLAQELALLQINSYLNDYEKDKDEGMIQLEENCEKKELNDGEVKELEIEMERNQNNNNIVDDNNDDDESFSTEKIVEEEEREEYME